ncbi:hypothetical protein TNIN_472321 [Trichonephila inaurata madagascariensis]|uniref:Uncharacterized protein n=1 Tax=Trichonephila inaurata madagascariensis TaxID=2747483 RepID=A0A8X7C877_9ARAC|nr:hypothetical protein TNIN_472321 [Trichonephila inaurata madagascariensis]
MAKRCTTSYYLGSHSIEIIRIHNTAYDHQRKRIVSSKQNYNKHYPRGIGTPNSSRVLTSSHITRPPLILQSKNGENIIGLLPYINSKAFAEILTLVIKVR